MFLSPDHELIRETARDFALQRVAPGVRERDEAEAFPHDLIPELADMGFLGIYHPTEYGGAGYDTLAFCLVIEEIARWDASLALTIASHTSLGSGHIALAGTHEQKERWLTPLAQGKVLAGWGLTEAGSGSDASGMKTTAVRDGAGWVLNGSKMFITQGSVGGVFVILAVTDRSKGAKGVTAFVVEAGTPGFSHGPKFHKLGMNSSDTRELRFEDVRIPDANRLGALGMGFVDTMKVLDGGRIGIAALGVGLIRGALEESVSYAKQRSQFGSPIGDFQAIRFKMSDMDMWMEAGRALTHRAAQLKDAGRPHTREASIAKLYTSEHATKAALEAIQIHGGYGYTKEYHPERFLRDAKLLEIGEGTSEVQRMVIGKKLMG